MMVSREVVWAKEAATMTSETAVDLRRIFFIGGSGMLNKVPVKFFISYAP